VKKEHFMRSTLFRGLLTLSLFVLLITSASSANYYEESVNDLNKSNLGFEHAQAHTIDSIAGTRCDSESPVVTSNDTIEIVESTVESETFTYDTKNQCGNHFQIFLSDNYVYQLDKNVVRYTERKQNNSFRPYFYSLKDNPTIRYDNGNFVVLEDRKLIESPDSEPVRFDYSKFTREDVTGRMDEGDFEFSGKLFYANERYTVDFEEPKAKCKIMDLHTNETLYLEKECIDAENNLVLIEGGQIFDVSSRDFITLNLTEEDIRDYRLTENGVFTDSASKFYNFDSEVVNLNRDYNSVDWIKDKTLWTDEPENYFRRINLREMSGEDFCSTIQTENTSCNYASGCECSSNKYNQSFEVSISSNKVKQAKRELNEKVSEKLEKIEPVENNTANSSQISNRSDNSTSSAQNGEDELTAAESLLGFIILLVIFGFFAAPVALIVFLIYRKYGSDEVDEEEESKPYQDLLEPLSNMPRENVIGESDSIWRFKAAIDLLLRGSTDYDTRKWKLEEVKELASKVESKFDEEDYRLDQFYLSGINGKYRSKNIRGNYLVGLSGQKLLRIELEPGKVGKVRKIKLKEFNLNSSFDNIEIKSRNSSKFDLNLNFDSRKDKSNFLDNLKSNLRSSGLSSYEDIWADEEKIKDLKKAKMGAKNNFQNVSPYEFEKFVAKLFRAKGYSARVTSKTGDAGIDVIARKNGEKVAIQAKRHKRSNKVGSPTVQKTLGSMHEINADKSIVVTSSGYTQPAKKRARNAPIELWDIRKIHREIDRNMI
jgi:hypothetical protein